MSGHALSRPLLGRTARRQKAGWLVWLAEAMRTIETRGHLAEMDARMLKDIGITRSQAEAEANRAPWDLAMHHPWQVR
jgi:uncharacterized protein YjiS (DUF1127 family)